MAGESVNINLGEFGGPVFVGRDRGEAARRKCDLDGIDARKAEVHVNVPQDTYSINSSFFLGLFGDSVRLMGTKAAFLARFHFEGPSMLFARLDEWIDRALKEKGRIHV